MAAPIAEPPHLATDLKTLCLSTIAAQWLTAEGMPHTTAAPATSRTATARAIPPSISTRVASSIMAIREDKTRRPHAAGVSTYALST